MSTDPQPGVSDVRGRSPIRTWTRALWILALFSVFVPLAMFAANAPRGASPMKFLFIAAVAWGSGAATVGALAGPLGLQRATGIGTALLLVFFSWQSLVELGQGLSIPGWLADWVGPIITLFLLIWASIRFGQTRGFGLALATVGLALVLTPLPGLASWVLLDRVSLDVRESEVANQTDTQPDVYFVVLDGYGRSDVLDAVYGYSNNPFLDGLAERGLMVPEGATANYSMTAASVASTLNMDYMVAPGTVPDHPLRLALYQVIRGDNPVARSLAAVGYEFVYIESGWDGSRCGRNVDTCYRSGFLDESSWALLSRTPLAVPLEAWFGHAFAQNGLRALDELTRVAGETSAGPRFVFAHVLLPHPPLILDGECQVRPEPQPGGGAVGARFLADSPALNDRKRAYVEQVQCTNTKILRFLDELGDDSVVFLTGDHGPDSDGQPSLPPGEWTEVDRVERFGVFSAYRLPTGCEQVEQDMDLINGMRRLVGCVTGEELEPVPRRHLIFPTPDGDPYPTTEVELATLSGG